MHHEFCKSEDDRRAWIQVTDGSSGRLWLGICEQGIWKWPCDAVRLDWCHTYTDGQFEMAEAGETLSLPSLPRAWPASGGGGGSYRIMDAGAGCRALDIDAGTMLAGCAFDD